jgi:hypothetical protein
MSANAYPRFPLGKLVATPNALGHITHDDIMAALWRHLAGDWGDLCAEDQLLNDRAAVEGARILSAYRAANGTTFWVITEADRSATTVLLPEDY